MKEALGKDVSCKLLFRATDHDKSNKKFHELCDGKGPLLVLFLTRKDILCGGFCSISWKSSANDEWGVDPKCFIFSLKLLKIYKRQNDTKNLFFHNTCGPYFGTGPSLGINSDNKLSSYINKDPF
jgi:hypothetical protein